MRIDRDRQRVKAGGTAVASLMMVKLRRHKTHISSQSKTMAVSVFGLLLTSCKFSLKIMDGMIRTLLSKKVCGVTVQAVINRCSFVGSCGK